VSGATLFFKANSERSWVVSKFTFVLSNSVTEDGFEFNKFKSDALTSDTLNLLKKLF